MHLYVFAVQAENAKTITFEKITKLNLRLETIVDFYSIHALMATVEIFFQ